MALDGNPWMLATSTSSIQWIIYGCLSVVSMDIHGYPLDVVVVHRGNSGSIE